jgi:hypothetical protein
MNQRVWLIAATISIGLSPSMAAQDAVPARDPDFREHLAKVAAESGQDTTAAAATRVYDRALADPTQMIGAVRTKMAVEGRTTKGAPYSAEAISESTQTLADGNHIVRKSVTRIYRDGEGRTRREEINEGGVVQSVSIVDPVAGTSIMLEPETRTAHRMDTFFAIADVSKRKLEAEAKGGIERVVIYTPGAQIGGPDGDPAEAGARVKPGMARRPTQESAGMMPPPPPPPPPPLPGAPAAMARPVADGGTTTREELGTQNVDAVTATGTRATTTIAAGAIGNEHPIKVVSEQWFSPDLQVLVLTRHSDPRQGETTYRLSNIVRAEPDRSLFTVPPDYTMKTPAIRER